MKHVIMGTAGHIDHGKSSLVKALTGIDPDRLKEEKERGITIELGFAYLDLPDGIRVGIVDVPGHEKFVRTMVAGAGGIDFVLLVIAADEGVMPQTKEHFEICRLLGIERGLVVLTKIDLVESELLELAKEEVREFIKGSFLDGSRIVSFSSVTLEGKDDLMSAIAETAKNTPERSAGPFRLNIDRTFTMKGFGTVATGTTVAGEASVGEEVMIYPDQTIAKIRGMQVHGQSVDKVEAGQRTALNLMGSKIENIERGMVVGKPNTLPVTSRADVIVALLDNALKLTAQTKFRFHTGTKEILARIVPLDEKLTSSKVGFAQIVLDEPTALVGSQRFVIRSYSPITTVGGGKILNPSPQRKKRRMQGLQNILDSLLKPELEEKILALALEAEANGISKNLAPALVGAEPELVNRVFDELVEKTKLVLINPQTKTTVHSKLIGALIEEAVKHVEKYHEKFPHREGVLRAELEEKLKPNELASKAVDSAIASNLLSQHEKWIRLPNFSLQISSELARDIQKLEQIYKTASATPPTVKELSENQRFSLDTPEILELAIRLKKLVKVSEELYYHHEVLNDIKSRLVEHLGKHDSISAAQFRDLFGFSRKFAVPLLEYFDTIKLTVRVGDKRTLRK